MILTIPRPGTSRVKEWFALFPVRIDREIRWLERVKVRQEYTEEPTKIFKRDMIREKWVNREFMKRGEQ